ncbi:heavy metal translocating P-type ATPase [Nocardia thailandica]
MSVATQVAHHRTAPPAPPPGRARFLALAEVRWALLALGLFALGGVAQLAGAPAWSWWALYLGCCAAGGWEPAAAGIGALRQRTLDVDLLMVVAAAGAVALGQITDAALLIVIFATSGALEAFATARTEDAVRGLLDLAPDTATRLRPDGREETVPARDLAVGDLILVRPGERIAADASVVAGGSEVDQSTITGESLPVDRTAGDEVFAGTLNGTGSLRLRVTRRAEDSVVARIAALVEEAARTESRTHLFVQKIEQRYSLGMVAVTLAVFAVPLAFGATVTDALLRAMTFMIVASPCAIVLATMPPLLAAMANAGRHGVLVKSAVVMEGLAAVDTVAFDKTGTLTHGTPAFGEIHVLAPESDTDRLLAAVAAVERYSEHPVARAITATARSRGLTLPEVTDFAARPGRGVHGTVEGRVIAVGAPREYPPGPVGAPVVADLAARGHTAVVVHRDGRPAAILSVVDTLRADAARAVAATARPPITGTVLLTGDNPASAARVAAAVGIARVHADLLPVDKVALVRELQEQGRRVAMVGDGVNDAPALAAAGTGIALGRTGADLSRQTADTVVLGDDLPAVPAVLALARRARRVVYANLVIAGVFIAVLSVWDLVGHLPLPLGVAGHEGSTVIVGLNGLRLLRRRAWTPD